jgi:murein DD-endopeptidase MepM/ murein hydrolase activator NlpD
MRDYLRRLLIVVIMALCISLLFIGGIHSEASAPDVSAFRTGWIWPAGGVISDSYGTRLGKHKGIDIAGKLDSPILAVEDGMVVKSYYSNTYGNVVFIKHPNNFVTVYAHLHKRNVNEGQSVKQAEVIGNMGRTGQATGVHLHFETHKMAWTYDKKYALDPEKLLGKVEVGETVQVGIASRGEYALEASSHFHQGANGKYIVRKGDTLTSIAKKKNLTVAELKKINQLKTDLIRPKQPLIIK